jgi:Tol biopolymer transport system component
MMGSRSRLRTLATVAVAAGSLALPAAAEAAFPGKNGRIAFTVQPRERGEALWSRIDTVLPSGADRRPLGTCPVDSRCFEHDPAWSPDGRLLAFGHFAAGLGSLAVVRGDGTGLRRLPQLTGSDTAPTWSPNGRRLAFRGEQGLYSVRRNGAALRPVLVMPGLGSPTWSLKGAVAFVNDDDPYRAAVENDGIYTIRPDGSRRRRIVRDRLNASSPASPDWSPHGSKIAFAFADSTDHDVHVANATGRRDRRLTWRGGTDPAWSPDGRYIAFIRSGDLYVMRSNGRGLRRVADGGTLETGEEIHLGSPSWQPLRR